MTLDSNQVTSVCGISPTPTPTPSSTPTATPTPASPPSFTGTSVIDNAGFFYVPTSLPAASTVAGVYQYAFLDYAATGDYSGAPSGWTLVCAV